MADLPEYGAPRDWYTVDTVRQPEGPGGAAPWEDAEHIPDSLLNDLLHVARHQIIEFAPVLPEDYPEGKCPASYRLAHLMQTRNLWNSVMVDSGGDMGGDDYTIRPVPLDWIVKQTLRPKRAVPVAL